MFCASVFLRLEALVERLFFWTIFFVVYLKQDVKVNTARENYVVFFGF